MAFFRLALADRNRGQTVVVLLEIKDVQKLAELGDALYDQAKWLLGVEWRRFNGRWIFTPCAVAVSQIAKINEVAPPRFEDDDDFAEAAQ